MDSNFSSDGQLIQFMYTSKFIRGIFYHSLLNNVPLSLDIEYACIDLMQVSGRVCIDFFGRGEGPQYICTHVNLVSPEIICLTSFLHPFRALLRCPASLRPLRNTLMISVLSSQDPYLLLRCMAVLLTVKISGCSCSSRATSGWTIPTCL